VTNIVIIRTFITYFYKNKRNAMKCRYLIIILFHSLTLLVSFLPCAIAQPKRLQFTHLKSDDGLSSSIVTSILQDHKGLIWIGTYDGLNRYDGFDFVVYRNNSADSASLANNVVRTIIEDHHKNLLIGTQHGLCLYDRDKDRFLNYMIDKSSPLKDIDCIVSKIAEDSIGNLWLATDLGLIYFDRIKNQIKRYNNDPDDPESLSYDFLEAVLIDRNNRLWITSRKGLNLFLPETGTFKHITRSENEANDLSGINFTDIAEDKSGNLWFGSTAGLYCLKNNPEARITGLIHYGFDPRDKFSLSINQVKSLYVDYSDNLWIGTENGGLNLFDRGHKRFWHYRKDDYDPKSLNNESIQTIYQDKIGNLWIGTFTGGLNISMQNRDAIISYQNLPGAPFSLSHNTVTSFLEDHNNQTWVGTDGGGLNLFDERTNHFRRFTMENSNISSNAVLCILEDSNHQIWFGTWAGGLVRFNSRTNSFTSFTTKNSDILDNNIYAIFRGDNNDLWLGSFSHGLIHYQIKENKFTQYTPDNSGLINKMIIKIERFSKGRLLIGSTNGFQIFSPDENRFITYMSDPNIANSLSYPTTTDILVENDSCVWIGTRNGLNRFNPNTGSFIRYYTKDGLPGNVIKGLTFDESGVLWVTTGNGVCRLNRKKGEIKNFTKADGLQGNEFSERSILKTHRGALLMGGTSGFNIIYPEKITDNKNIPEVLITDLKILNVSADPGVNNSLLIKNIIETKNLILSYRESVLTFYFAVMDFTAPGKNQYAYMMKGFDKGWIYSGNKREATYTNLNPGDYVFHVKGSNNDRVWNETGTSIHITILPPWWSTWWFRLIAVFAIIFIVISVFLSRVRSLKNQKILLEKSVAIKTSELQELNVSKDKFFSIIAHDLKNPFQAIIGFSEMLKEEMKSGDIATSENYAGLINTSANQTFRLLENLLEWANSQRGKITFNPVSINLRELVNEEFGVLSDMAKGKNIVLKSSFDDNLSFIADKNMINTILRNLISNAIKFTHKNGRVEVMAMISNNQVEISVSDNGIGMTNETMAKLFRLDGNLSTRGTENEKGTGLGLFLCKEFVEKHGGKIWVESESGKGSIFKMVLPSTINHQG
jgi:signal transduction histidine kinase/ligand-binding sensor domain-containing protein